MGRFLILGGLVLIAVGVFVILAEKSGIALGRLPGDIRLHGRRGTFYFPIVTCLLISAVLSLIGWIINRH
jgi:hypothetical protein